MSPSRRNSVRTLGKIQSDCTNLSRLATTLSSTDATTIELDALDNPNIVVQALALVNTSFRAISSPEIIVEIYEERPSTHIRKTMKNYGWTIKVTEQAEESESDRYLSDFDDYDDEYRYDYDSVDDYDIDNDSDFWRRAAD